MELRWLLAAAHLLGFGIGLGAVWTRARSIRSQPLDEEALRRTFAADSWWGVSALLLIGSGVWRLLSGTEKLTLPDRRCESTILPTRTRAL